MEGNEEMNRPLTNLEVFEHSCKWLEENQDKFNEQHLRFLNYVKDIKPVSKVSPTQLKVFIRMVHFVRYRHLYKNLKTQNKTNGNTN